MSMMSMSDVDWELLGSVESLKGGDPDAVFPSVLAREAARFRRQPDDEPLARQNFADGWAAGIAARG